MALDKVKQGVIADDAVGSSQIAPDTVVAADIGANAITASELADNAVDTAAIASNAVTTAKITDANITTAKIADTNITSAKLNTDVTDGSAITTEVKPHIIPGMLYPAIGGKGIDGTTTVSSFGTDVTINGDTRQYYYTDIKGSKPIEDPRIGAYFGAQRHMFKSAQLLDDESAAQEKNVWSLDGRKWCRACTSDQISANDTPMIYHDHGLYLWLDDTDDFIEITGYFNNFNTMAFTHTNRADDIEIKINGGTARDNDIVAGKAGVFTPLSSRHVDAHSVINHNDANVTSDLGTTPRINTLKLRLTNISSEYFLTNGIELVAQDTTSTANKSKIQIPVQNVVSHGKKFPISATAHHYNPFAFAENGTTAVAIGNTTSHGKLTGGWASGGTTAQHYDSTLDTTTSLGLSAWHITSGSDAGYYRPVNGGRIVKWVDSSGNIKTSVNVMPPAARHVAGGGNNGLPTGTSWLTAFKPSFMAGAVDQTQAEVAKAFIWREFGNGSANSGPESTRADASMLHGTNDNIAYVMDDGLTSLSGTTVAHNDTESMFTKVTGESKYWVTFIGTGISVRSPRDPNTFTTIGQNLPYGTHILEVFRDSSATPVKLDGVQISANYTNLNSLFEVSFHQPKRPPIPEDAVVLADYMLMADFVKKDSTGTSIEYIAKGARRLSGSRDCFYDGDATPIFRHAQMGWSSHNIDLYQGSSANNLCRIPSFSVNALQLPDNAEVRHQDLKINGSSVAQTNTGTAIGSFVTASSNVDLGMNIFEVAGHTAEGTNNSHYEGWEFATPTHTSSHYQEFENPYLKELIGGDRNMEQTNLVCSPDGKTWDEITRDTSYIGKGLVSAATQTNSSVNDNAHAQFDEVRGGNSTDLGVARYNKDFAIAQDGYICLKAGFYKVTFRGLYYASNHVTIKVNSSVVTGAHHPDAGYTNLTLSDNMFLQRGDNVQIYDKYHGGVWAHFFIERI